MSISSVHVMGDNLITTIAPESRYDEFVDYVFNDFFPRESLALSSGLMEQLNDDFRVFIEKWLSEGISLITIDSSTDQIVGICLNYVLDESSGFPTDQSDTDEIQPLDRIISFLNHLEEGYDAKEKFGNQTGMELLFLGTKEGYSGRGIARNLAEKAMELARTKQIGFIQCNPTAGATRHIFRSLDFETISEMKLVDYFINDQPGFPYAGPEEITQFVVKQLWLLVNKLFA